MNILDIPQFSKTYFSQKFMSSHLHKPKKDILKTLYSSCQISSASVRIKSCEQSYKQQEFSGSLDRQTLRPHRQIREGAQLNDFVCFSKVICCVLLSAWTTNYKCLGRFL